jgi:hypothetical protein
MGPAKAVRVFSLRNRQGKLPPRGFQMKKHSPCHSSPSGNSITSWHALYQAALFETDRQLIPARISEAERAILNRVKELFGVDSDHIEEDQILDDALYALRALRSCMASDVNAA